MFLKYFFSIMFLILKYFFSIMFLMIFKTLRQYLFPRSPIISLWHPWYFFANGFSKQGDVESKNWKETDGDIYLFLPAKSFKDKLLSFPFWFVKNMWWNSKDVKFLDLILIDHKELHLEKLHWENIFTTFPFSLIVCILKLMSRRKPV